MSRYIAAFAAALALLVTPVATAAAETHTVRIATVAPDQTPWAELLKLYKKNVEEASGGRLKVKLYLGGTRGDENSAVRKTARGRLQATGASTGAVASLVPELNAVEIPFLFRSAEEADYVLDKKLLKPMEKLFRDRGLVLGFWSENGFRHFAADTAIESPGSLRGKKMRSQESFVHLEMWKALGASPSAIPTTEVVTALKTGAVEGYDQGLLYAIAASWHSSVKHLTLSAHIYQPAVIAFNKAWFDKLPDDLQKILLDEGRAIVKRGRKAIRKINPELVKIFQDSGVKVSALTGAQRKKFESATKKVRESFRKSQGKQSARILGLIEEGLKEYRAGKR